MPSATRPRIAIVGAGIAGLTCARRLADAGLAPVVFDKSRGLGGRIATRRTAEGLTFDHGAQFARAHGSDFAAVLKAAIEAGMAAPWPAADAIDAAPSGTGERIVGIPGMSSLVKPLATGLDIRVSHTLAALRREGGAWRLEFAEEDAVTHVADAVALCLPAPQVAALLTDHGSARAELERVRIAPCWTLMVAFDAPPASLPDAARCDAGPIAWIARSASKPGRPGEPRGFVVHATPDWSRAHLELTKEEACTRLLTALGDLAGAPLPRVRHAAAHRWRYAMTETPLGRPFLEIAPDGLFAAGDWCLGARIEAGHDSGAALADRLLTARDLTTRAGADATVGTADA